MAIIVITYFGEKITIRNKTKRQALQYLAERGLPFDWIASVQETRK